MVTYIRAMSVKGEKRASWNAAEMSWRRGNLQRGSSNGDSMATITEGYGCNKKREAWAGEMAQRLRALTALWKVQSSNPSNHMVAHNDP